MSSKGSPDQPTVLVCFALRDEAKFFAAGRISAGCRILITGMGQKNAGETVRRTLAAGMPRLVVTAGFAGGLNPARPLGTVVFDEDEGAGLGARLTAAGAVRGKFHCAENVIVTAADKRALWHSTGADAVEMESEVIRAICRELNIPAATIRVISDPADEDLPIDFNRLMTPDYRLSPVRLAGQLLRAPGKIRELIRFQKRTLLAARNLAGVLEKSLAGTRG